MYHNFSAPYGNCPPSSTTKDKNANYQQLCMLYINMVYKNIILAGQMSSINLPWT